MKPADENKTSETNPANTGAKIPDEDLNTVTGGSEDLGGWTQWEIDDMESQGKKGETFTDYLSKKKIKK